MSLPGNATVMQLRHAIAVHTGVEEENQTTLAFKGSNQSLLKADPLAAVAAVGLKSGWRPSLFTLSVSVCDLPTCHLPTVLMWRGAATSATRATHKMNTAGAA